MTGILTAISMAGSRVKWWDWRLRMKKGEDRAVITFTPLHKAVMGSPAYTGSLSAVEQLIQNHLTSAASIAVTLEDDEGLVMTSSGQQALLLTYFMSVSANPLATLNQELQLLFIPQLFGHTLVPMFGVQAALEENSGTLIWINVSVAGSAAEAPAIDQPMTIQFFTNPGNQVQINLIENHVTDIAGVQIVATVVLEDNISTRDPLKKKRSMKQVRRDSMTDTEYALDFGADSSVYKRKPFTGRKLRSLSEGGEGSADGNKLMLILVCKPYC